VSDVILVAANSSPPIIGVSEAMRRAVEQARRFAARGLPVLITGPTGTGKELFARHVHAWSGRVGRLVPVNCGALPRDLVEGLLFGRRRGVYTGADDAKGYVEAADRGTLFLDELGSLPLEAQVKLLRVLEEMEVYRLGDTVGRAVRFGLVAATQDDLRQLIPLKAFRQDLFQRVAGGIIALPALATRLEDVAPLAEYFAEISHRKVTATSLLVLQRYSWPGNVRELRAVIDRAACLSDGPELEVSAICEAIDSGAMRDSELVEPKINDMNRRKLHEACEANGWSATRTARALGIGRTTLFRRLKAVGISLRST
jgi:transcriptional regulator with PAS, ATPase and Fis domain